MVKKEFFATKKNPNEFAEELSNENKIHATFKDFFFLNKNEALF